MTNLIVPIRLEYIDFDDRDLESYTMETIVVRYGCGSVVFYNIIYPTRSFKFFRDKLELLAMNNN